MCLDNLGVNLYKIQMMYLVVSGMIIGLFLILTVFRTENSANRALTMKMRWKNVQTFWKGR